MKFPKPTQLAINAVLKMIQEKEGGAYIVTICMHCEELLGVKDGVHVAGISHGICPDCLAHYRAENELRISP
jgi:hypothetical protein